MDSDFVVGIDKSIDAAKGITGREYPSYLHNTVVTEKLDELAEAISEGSGGASALSDLTDVDISGSVQGGKVLKYNAVEEKWAPGDDSGNVQSDWNENDPTSGAFILNKPSIPNAPIELTQAEYDALTPAEKMSDTPYLITDANGDGSQFQPVIYSTTEREIGVWTDGKPLYEKTVSATIENSSAQILSTVYNAEYKSIEGFFSSPSGIVPVPFNDGSSRYVPYTDGDDIKLAKGGASQGVGNTIVLTVQYTKSTDTPGSGVWTPQGVPAVHYSTDEQVVGTWIDGKTLYEKTVHIQPSGDTADYTNAEIIPDIDITIESAFVAKRYDAPVDVTWYYTGNGTTSPESVNYSQYKIGVRVSNGYLQYYVAGYGAQITDIWATIRYTKSST